MKRRYLHILLLLAVYTAVNGCKKKNDFEYDNRVSPDAITKTNTRLVDFTGNRELEIGDTRLTSFLPPDATGGYSSDGSMRVTKYFPGNGQLATPFVIPAEFVGKDGKIDDLRMTSLAGNDAGVPLSRPFTLQDKGLQPIDYYHVLFSPHADGLQDSMFAIPRDISPSSNPSSFRIRLLNLSSQDDPYGKTGNLTLTWANGKSVDSRTSNIAPGAYSDYIDIPYGTFQFKVLAPDGREVPARPIAGMLNTVVSPSTGTLMGAGDGQEGAGGFLNNWLSFAPIKNYQPGGVYTIAVSKSYGYEEASVGALGQSVPIALNCFRIINDISEPANNVYARIQAVNTIPGKELKWAVNGTEMGTTAFAANTNYAAVITGAATLRMMDGSGAVLAEKTIQLSPADNITAWAFTGKDGKTDISFSSNNLSSVYSNGSTGDDGSYGFNKDAYPFWVRFMNFCADLDEVTFTENNGAMFPAEGSKHLQYGVAAIDGVYATRRINTPRSLLVFASSPGLLPGDWVTNIAPLNSLAFMDDITLYKTPAKPDSEPGVYTVALVGSTADGAAEKARMIVVKHTR